MEIPKYDDLMLPLLKSIKDGKEHSFKDLTKTVANDLKLSEEMQRDLLPSGRKLVFVDCLGWAKTYLKQAGLIEYPKRNYLKITKEGINLLNENHEKIDGDILKRYDSFNDFLSRTGKTKKGIESGRNEKSNIDLNKLTPEEIIEHSYNNIRSNVSDELLDLIKSNSPEFFEQLVVDLLLNMGYGGSREDAGQAIGKLEMKVLME